MRSSEFTAISSVQMLKKLNVLLAPSLSVNDVPVSVPDKPV